MMRGFLVLCLLLITAPASANLITNGDFETGDFTGWTVNGNFTGVTTSPFDFFNAYQGTYFAYLGTFGSVGKISQSVSDVAGGAYTLSMYVGSDGLTPNNLTVYWNNAIIYSQNSLPDTRGNASQYNLLTFTVTGTGNDLLAISERNDPGYFALDNVSLNLVPEPASMTLAGLGIVGMACGAYRRYRKNQVAA